MLLDLGLLELLILERILIESSLGLALVGGVLLLSLVSTNVVVARASLMLALLGATDDEVVGVPTIEASVL
jgi:Cu/Ag efflux pump CusA